MVTGTKFPLGVSDAAMLVAATPQSGVLGGRARGESLGAVDGEVFFVVRCCEDGIECCVGMVFGVSNTECAVDTAGNTLQPLLPRLELVEMVSKADEAATFGSFAPACNGSAEAKRGAQVLPPLSLLLQLKLGVTRSFSGTLTPWSLSLLP